MITTICESDQEILSAIIELYMPHGIDIDPTYSTGGFYKSGIIPQPDLKLDINPQVPGVLQADCCDLRFWLPDDSVYSVVIDLPFIHAPGKESIMGNRFSGFKSQKELREVYATTAIEAYRYLSMGGIIAWKLMDIVESGKQNWTHVFMVNHCWLTGFDLEDLFILGKRSGKPVGHNHNRQVHAKKAHCYWLVFRKVVAPPKLKPDPEVEDPQRLLEDLTFRIHR